MRQRTFPLLARSGRDEKVRLRRLDEFTDVTAAQCAEHFRPVRSQNVQRRSPLRLLDPVRDKSSLFATDIENAANWGHCPMTASGSLANPTAWPDRYDGVRIAGVETGRIHRLPGMLDLASEHYGDRPGTGEVVAAAPADSSRNVEIGHVIRRTGELHEDLSGIGKSSVNVPKRTRAAKARKLKPGRTAPLQHVAGDVRLHEVERNARSAGPLESAEPVANLLEAGSEAALQSFDVVVRRLRRFEDQSIGQD